LLDAIAKEPRAQQKKTRAPWWGVLGWIAAAAMVVVAVVLSQQNARLKEDAAQQAKSFEQQKAQLEKASAMAAILQSPDAERYEVMPVSVKTMPPSGKAIYSPDRGLVFIASNMNPLPPQKAYELWLIPKQGAPIPAGVFKPDTHGNVAMMHSPMPAGVEAKAFAITIEPEQGSATPTMPIVMMGAGG
jgi:anti-sigma-K factor RskA